MSPEAIYSLPELARLTGRSYEFWDEECSSGRLEYLQPRGRGTKRLVEASAYARWREASLGQPVAPSVTEVFGRARSAGPWVEFAA